MAENVDHARVSRPLMGEVALVAGATRGAGRGTAVSLGEAGTTVYCNGRSTGGRRSEYDRPETIEETAELVTAAGGVGIAIAVDHLDAGQVEALVQRIAAESGRLDVLVNDIWGGEMLFEWETPVREHDFENGLRLLRLAHMPPRASSGRRNSLRPFHESFLGALRMRSAVRAPMFGL